MTTTIPATQDDGILIGAVQKNARGEEIRIRLTSFKNVDLVDLRLYYEPDNSQEKRPTGKGFAIRRELLPNLIDVLQQAQDRAGLEEVDESEEAAAAA